MRPTPCRKQSGQALIEFTFGGLMLITLVFGLIDFGRAIYSKQILTSLSREAANLSSRGTSLANTVSAIKVSANPIDIDTAGYIIITVISRDSSGLALVADQVKSGGWTQTSRVGAAGIGQSPTLPVTTELLPQPKQRLYAAEVFAKYQPITPIGTLLNILLPDTLYDVAYF